MVFSIPSYLGLGDRPKRVVDERGKGLNFISSKPKTGKGNDAFSDGGAISNKYLWVGERSADPETTRRREAMASIKKNLTVNGFVQAGPAQKGEGLGSYFGCFQSTPYQHVPNYPEKRMDRVAETRARKARHATDPEPRGIYTSPAPKGCGYGYPGLAISDIGSNYVATFYDAPRRAAREERERWAKRMPSEPFKPCGRVGFTFDESLSTGVSKCYVMTAPFKERPPERPVAHFNAGAVWRPAGFVDDMPAVVEYWEDPLGGYDPRLSPKSYIRQPSDKIFYPSSRGDTFWYTQSIVFKRL